MPILARNSADSPVISKGRWFGY